MTDITSSNGASGADAGDISMAGSGGTSSKRGGGSETGADIGAAESASFDEAPSVTQTPPVAGGTTGETAAAGENSTEDQSRLRASLKSIEARSQELRRWAASQQDTAREVIEDKPVAVIASAFGIGLLLGVMAAKL